MASIIKVSTTINTYPETVWENLMNPDNLKFWLTDFLSAEHLTDKKGEEGSKSRLRFNERGKEIEVIETVLLSKPHQQYNSRMEHPAFAIENDMRLVSFGQRTELIQTVQFQPKSFITKLFLPLMKGAMKKRSLNELLKLKHFIETNNK